MGGLPQSLPRSTAQGIVFVRGCMVTVRKQERVSECQPCGHVDEVSQSTNKLLVGIFAAG